MADYTQLTDAEFDNILEELVSKMSASQILAFGDVNMFLREELNNEILDTWAERNPEKCDTRPEVKVYTWFERDRAHVELRNEDTDETILEFWDDDVNQAVEAGILDPRDWEGSIIKHAEELGVLK
jgi:hypothetical protein